MLDSHIYNVNLLLFGFENVHNCKNKNIKKHIYQQITFNNMHNGKHIKNLLFITVKVNKTKTFQNMRMNKYT